MPMHTLSQASEAINHHGSFLLSAHIDPEGDCVASLLALDSLLQKIKKKSYVLCADPVPEQLRFLDTRRWHAYQPCDILPDFDAGIIVDCPTLERIGQVKEIMIQKNAFLINIDHHISNRAFGNINYVDVNAAACGELIYDLFNHFKVPLTREDCQSIYVSLSTDTGSFRYSNTTAKTHEIVADLLRHGLDIEKLNESLYENMPRRKLDLFRMFLERIEFNSSGRIICAILEEKDLKKSGARKSDLEGFVEYLRSISGVEVAFLITEQGENSRVSFRSKGNFDVNKLANFFGGGGHRKASGCTIQAIPEISKNKILNRIAEQAMER